MDWRRVTACGWLLAVLISAEGGAAEQAPFTAFTPATGAAEVVLFHQADADGATIAGWDWETIAQPRLPQNTPEYRLREAVKFLQEGIGRMTGHPPVVRSSDQTDQGIVLLLLATAPAAIQRDPAVIAALASTGEDAYNDREAFYLRSEAKRLLVVANTIDGLAAAAPALLESVDYEVLGMGPNWIHTPDHTAGLTFDLELSDRPRFYLRQLTPTTGQYRGVGTLQTGPKLQLSDPHDEGVGESYVRWAIGSRNWGRSMAPFPGHALYVYHRPLVEYLRKTGTTDGFLTPATRLGLEADRPPATPASKSELWINTDAAGEPGHGRVFVSSGTAWEEQKLVGMHVNVDTTTPVARELVLARMQDLAAKHFETYPSEPFVFGVEAEDGAGLANSREWVRPENRRWYPEYLQAEGVDWPQPYRLHGYRGIDQPREQFDHGEAADLVFAFNNWLLREFDKWIDSLPPEEQVTRTGQAKKSLVRTSLYSYAYHDIPPHFNLDPRIRVMIAGYPKHRGLGRWKAFATRQSVAAALKELLPREPSAEYRIISIAYYADHSLDGIPARWSASPSAILADLDATHQAGVRALTCEMDFNGGKYGLAYYLMAKALWNRDLTAAQLDALRDRWLQRAYGSAWPQMKAYYDYMLIENFPVSAPAAWAKAIRLIEAADVQLDPAVEPAAQKRLDDLKQYWYFYYLLDQGAMEAKSPELIEFLWKGQMSYATAMHMVLRRTFPGQNRIEPVVPAELQAGPAHYTPEETARWWRQVLEHWPLLEVDHFAEQKLADGRLVSQIDQWDLVGVKDYQTLRPGAPFLYNSAQAPPTTFLATGKAGEPIGFQCAWKKGDVLRFYGPKDVSYGVEYWDREQREWSPVIDPTTTFVASEEVTSAKGQERHRVTASFPAPHTGVYRFEVGPSGFLAQLTSLGYDFVEESYTAQPAFMFPQRPRGLTQGPAYFYIPQGTRSLDLEVWDAYDQKFVQLYSGQDEKGLVRSREVDISRRGTHRIPLEPGETGRIASIRGNGFAFPLLYSVPSGWAKSPAELLVPRAIAEADKLQIAP
ncbi:hypothetical protein [Lignipirellula cremea]|uniref:Uncharacterized protein n=1 Tax=Lignipirellula cremea TaxID=2528010 RepID=A0A518DZD4_9BACT|nr:hypothetical protein [Lignipirellula cremea]QDU97206.1 hypothetical protein Pla8534_50510 [Lignipirellula cremea]